MSSFIKRRAARSGPLGRFARNKTGSAALEFAFVAPVFFTLAFSIIEGAWQFTRISLIENAASDIYRMIYTGQVSDGDITQSTLESAFCDKIEAVTDCGGDIAIEVTQINSFTDLPSSSATCKDKDDESSNDAGYNFTSGDEIVYVRFCVTVDILTPGLGLGLMLPKTDNDKYQIITQMVFRNEPF
ncbi:MAG: TadE/TadG family type IV pilus assembly protein [Pseudomonadota bacterium]